MRTTNVSAWLHSICLVDFLSDHGHHMSLSYPPNSLSPEEAQRVTKLALPSGDRVIAKARPRSMSFAFQILIASRSDGVSPPRSLFGFCHFDVSPAGEHVREWRQSSVVLLTPLPHFRVFTNLARLVSDTLSSGNPARTFSHVYLAAARLPVPPALKPTRLSLKTPEVSLDVIVPPTPIQKEEHLVKRSPGRDDSFYSAEEEGTSEVASKVVSIDELWSLAAEESIEASSVEIPVTELPLKKNDLMLDGRFIGHTPDLQITHSCAGLLPCILILWEAVLTASPILTICRTSMCVMSLPALIAPLVYWGQCRPLVDTYEPDFNVLASCAKFSSRYGRTVETLKRSSTSSTSTRNTLYFEDKKDGLILGTTNPVCLTSIGGHCPTILGLAVPAVSVYVPTRAKRARYMQVNPIESTAAFREHVTPAQPTVNLLPQSFASTTGDQVKGWMLGAMTKAGLAIETRDLVYATHNPDVDLITSDGRWSAGTSATISYILSPHKSAFSCKDHSFFLASWRSTGTEAERALRDALYDLTEDFLRAFEPYLTFDLRPLHLNPFQDLPRPPVFVISDFLEKISTHGMFSLMSRNRLKRLYSEFLATSNFRKWFSEEYKKRARAAERSQIALCLSTTVDILPSLATFELERGVVSLERAIESMTLRTSDQERLRDLKEAFTVEFSRRQTTCIRR